VSNRVAQNTAWLLVGYAARMGSQALAFVLLARSLGVTNFGVLAAAIASANLIAPLVEYGAYNLVVRDVVNGVPTNRSVGMGLAMSALALPFGLIFLSGVKLVLLPQIPWEIVVIVGTTIFFGNRMTLLANGVHTAHGLLWRNAVVEIANGSSLLLLAFMFSRSDYGLQTWTWWAFAQSFCVGTLALLWVALTWGVFTSNVKGVLDRVREGAHFAINGLATNAYVDLDKALLTRFSTLEAVSTFSAGHRFVVLANVPLAAFMGAIYPKFFARGRDSLAEARRFAWRVVPLTFGYGVLAALLTWLLAPLFVSLLGNEFAETTSAIRWLCWIIPFQCLQLPFMEALTGSGRQSIRTVGQVIALGINCLVNVTLIGRLGWVGAAVAALMGQIFLTVYMMIAAHGREPKAPRAFEQPTARS
jgi:O-antigen/teichoic acid export membrane protein